MVECTNMSVLLNALVLCASVCIGDVWLSDRIMIFLELLLLESDASLGLAGLSVSSN